MLSLHSRMRSEHSVLQGISPTPKNWTDPFLPRPPQKNTKSVRPLPLWGKPLKILENLTLSSQTHGMYPYPKKQRLIFWRNERFYFQQWNYNTLEHWRMNIQLQNLKIKELGFFYVFYFSLVVCDRLSGYF